MADLNALIAQGAQFRVPPPVDPMGNMPQLMQMQSMQQQNQLNQMTMQEKQRGQQEMNALRRLDPSSATYLQDVKQINPKMGFEFEKMQQDAKTAGTEGQIKNVKLLTDRLALLPEAYRRADTPEAYLTLHQSIHADPVVGPWLKSTGATLERGLATIQTAVDTGKFNELRADSMQSVAQILDSMKPQPDAALMKQLGYAQTPEGFRAFQEAKRAPTAPTKSIGSVSPGDFTPASVAKFNVSGNYGDLVPKPVDRAAVAEPAPTITQVVDPKNPKQMLNVNARLYRGGSLGDPGVIGVAGREPGYVARDEKAAAKQTETDKSRRQVDDLVAQLGGYYDALSDEGGITSTGLRAGSNVMAGIASSGLGQATGRLFGTQAQSQRNSIVQMRPLLVQAIKNATGMSSKQMDSNVELKMMLATATDPTLDLEANRRALVNLAALYGTGGEAAPAPLPGAPTRANAAKADPKAEAAAYLKTLGITQ